MRWHSGSIFAVFVVALAHGSALAQVAVDAQPGLAGPMGLIGRGTLAPLKTFQNDATFVAGGKVSNLTCVSDGWSHPTCGMPITHRLPSGYDPDLSDVVLGGFRITKVSGGTLPQGLTYRLGAEVVKTFYDKTTGDFQFDANLDFGPDDQPIPNQFVGEVEYWIVLTNGTRTWSKSLDASCTGKETCTGSTFFLQDEIPAGMTFMNSALQMFSMSVDVKTPDQIKEFGIDATGWHQGLVYVYDPKTGTNVEKTSWQVDPVCRFVAKTPGLWSTLSCSTRSLAFAATDGWYEAKQASYSASVSTSAWSQTISVPVPFNARGVFTGLSAFDVAYSDAVPATGNTEVRAGCFRPTSSNPPMGSVVFEGLLTDAIPPTVPFTGGITCLTGWARTP